MTVLYLVVPLALAIVAAAVVAFVWATRRGQFDDLDTPAMRMLHDDADRHADGARDAPPSGTSADDASRTPANPRE
jgi:cbb3-type cytochrome oxidase maturation protein